ncbi:MAG TPA: phage tail protein [Desulfuromonadales bacterium]|nr:phage tail protein [Desulfuromonadales bacterium]
MRQVRDSRYATFNFLVEMESGQGTEVQAGFSDVSGLSADSTVAEYHPGNSRVNADQKIPRLHKAGEITLKRGGIGSQSMLDWLELCRSGNAGGAQRNIVIRMLSEDRKKSAVSWKLVGAVPAKWTGPALSATGGGDVAMEELVLSVEMVTLE